MKKVRAVNRQRKCCLVDSSVARQPLFTSDAIISAFLELIQCDVMRGGSIINREPMLQRGPVFFAWCRDAVVDSNNIHLKSSCLQALSCLHG